MASPSPCPRGRYGDGFNGGICIGGGRHGQRIDTTQDPWSKLPRSWASVSQVLNKRRTVVLRTALSSLWRITPPLTRVAVCRKLTVEMREAVHAIAPCVTIVVVRFQGERVREVNDVFHMAHPLSPV